MPPKRKYLSGYDKRMKKKKLEELTQSQSGALDNFLLKKPQIVDENPNVVDVNAEIFEKMVVNENINSDNQSVDVNVPASENKNVDDQYVDVNDDDGEDLDNLFHREENDNYNEQQPDQYEYSFDIFDPRN
ncbi:uncharacterized protein LOC110727266 [Chenopodium quinoa]|uniref:uncharacterized protein LOC110727266 n=1 Tax=Chenopodium quinoa TaxID=63459 RepID=UPI000B78409B|nr:uncharacterized protein LOC110727266 [Chenopodium quinoa]